MDIDKLSAISQDVEERLIPKQKPFFRHFLVHEKDFLRILHLSIRSLKQEEVSSKQNSEEAPSQKLGAGILYNNADILNKEKEHLKTNLHTPQVKPKKMEDNNNSLSKRIKRIIDNNNLSPNTKTELIHDLITTLQKQKVLAIQREKLPSRNSMLLLGAGSSNTANVTRNDQYSSNDNDDNTNNITENNSDNIDDNIDDDNDNDDDNDDNEDNTMDNVYDAEQRHNAPDAVLSSTPLAIQRSNRKNPLILATNKIKDICRSHKLSITKANVESLDEASRSINDYLSIKCSNGMESIDRRFMLNSSGIITFRGYDNNINMSLQKLLVTLCFSKTSLFNFLEATSRKQNKAVTPYSNGEKKFISSFVNLASINPALIPCLKIRALCM